MYSARNGLSEAAKSIEASIEEITTSYEYLKNIQIDEQRGFDTSRLLPIIDMPFSFIWGRLLLLQEKLRSFPETLPDLAIPTTLITNISGHSGKILDHARQLKVHLEALLPHGGPQPTTWANIELANADRQLNLQLVAHVVQPILNYSDSVLSYLTTLSIILDPSQIHVAISDTKLIAATVLANTEINKIQKITVSTEAALKNAQNIVAKLELLLSTSTQTEAFVKQSRENIATLEGDTISKKAAADAAIAAATELKEQVDQYAAEFSVFQKTLDSRIIALQKGNDDLAKLSKKFTDQTDEVSGLIDRAKAMLSSATNAGLTHAQQEKYNEIGNQLFWAGFWVFIAYVALFISVIPVVRYVWEVNTIEFGSVWTYMGNVLARAVLLIPGGIAASFTTKRYMRLFRLRHEYAYRASLAGAVEGFRIQAPEHAQDLTAVAFYQLGLNPARTIDRDSESPDWYKKLTEIVEKFSNRFGQPPKKDDA
ncbi:hypothetical protein [Ferrovibrio sp.]|uniref:hypothetical protein n=1 Tax=Ferrovibrio sp. TaxID=1917215 RepID=UPI003D2A8668